MARRRPADAEVERKVHFYRADVGSADGAPVPFPTAAVADRINELGFANGERYLPADRDVSTCVWVDRGGATARLRIANVRHGGLPEVEQGGELSPLDLPANAGLAETMHVVFFPNNIVGCIYNYYAPRLLRFAYYLQVKAADVVRRPMFEQLLRHDAHDRILDLRHITLLQLRITPAYIEAVEAANESLAAAFRSAFEVGDAQQAEIILQPKPRARDEGLGNRVRRLASRLARRAPAAEGVLKFVVKGYDRQGRQSDIIDVLSDELIVTRTVRVQEARTRALVARSAYEAIEGAFAQMERQLNEAAAIGIGDDNE